MPLIPNLLGQRVRHGRSSQRLVDFEAGLASAWPSSLTLGGTPGPTVTWNNITAGNDRGSVRVATGASAGNTASLSGPVINDPSQLGAIFWCFEGLQYDATGTGLFDIILGLDGATSGGRISHGNAAASGSQGRYLSATVVGGGGAVGAAIPTVRHSLRTTTKQNLTIGLFPAWKAMVLQGDPEDLAGNVYVVDNDPGMAVNTAITPRLLITNTNAASHWFQFTAVRLLIEFN